MLGVEKSRDSLSVESAVSAYAALPVAIGLIKLEDASYVAVNDAYATLLRRSPADFPGRSTASLGIWDEDPAVQAQVFERIRRGMDVESLEAKLLASNQEPVRVGYSARLLRLEGAPYILETLERTEELARLRRARVGADSRFQGVFNGNRDGLSIHELDGQLAEANPALCELLDTPRELLRGRGWLELHPPALETVSAEMFHRARAGHDVDFESRLQRPGTGDIPVSIRLRRIDTLGAPIIVAAYRDLRATEALQQRLLQAQKMEAIGRLVSGVSHDFNNILTVIRGLAFILQDALPDEHPEQETVEELDRAAQRAAGLTRQLLVFGRRKDADRVDLDIGQVLRDLNRMLRRLVPASVELSFSYGEDVPPVNADPGRVEHLIALLAVRAKEYGDGGRLEFDTIREQRDGNARAVLKIRDTIGRVDHELLQRYSSRPVDHPELARALNLVEVVETCNSLGCDLDLRPTDEGALDLTFAFRPAALESDTAVESLLDGPFELEGHETILLAEDEASLRTLVAEGLRRHGYTVLTAADPVEAHAVATRHAGIIDLLITDVVMPRGSGIELAAHLRVKHPELGVLFVSGYAEHAALHELPDGPNTAFIQKVFTQMDLLRAVRALMDVRPPSSPGVGIQSTMPSS